MSGMGLCRKKEENGLLDQIGTGLKALINLYSFLGAVVRKCLQIKDSLGKSYHRLALLKGEISDAHIEL